MMSNDTEATLSLLREQYIRRGKHLEELKAEINRVRNDITAIKESSTDVYELFESEAKVYRESIGCGLYELTLREFEINVKHYKVWRK